MGSILSKDLGQEEDRYSRITHHLESMKISLIFSNTVFQRLELSF